MIEDEGGRRERNRRELLNRIEDAAFELFVTQGYRATTMDQIAERADTARRTLFNYFPRKRDILEIWSNRRREQLSSLFDDEALSGAPAREQLVRHLSVLAAVNTDDPDLARVITTGRVVELAAFDEPFPVFDALQVSVTLGQESGEFRAEPSAALVAEVLTSFYTDTLQRWLLAGDAQAFSLDDVLQAKLALVLDGLTLT